MLHKIVQKVWETETIPQKWEEGLICPIHKKGDPLECQNYRGITLLNTMFKFFSSILYTRLKPYVEEVTGSCHCGFREGKSTTDKVQVLHQILERTREFKIDAFRLFINFKAACDSIKDKLLSTCKNLECQ
jgi:sorting nexin-29